MEVGRAQAAPLSPLLLLHLTWRDSCVAFPLRPRGRQTRNMSGVEHSEPGP